MANILVQFNYQDSDIEIYEKTIKDLEAVGLGNVPERLYHVTARIENGWHVTDVWESEESFQKFGNVVMPIISKNGGTPVEPSILQVHNIIVPE